MLWGKRSRVLKKKELNKCTLGLANRNIGDIKLTKSQLHSLYPDSHIYPGNVHRISRKYIMIYAWYSKYVCDIPSIYQ